MIRALSLALTALVAGRQMLADTVDKRRDTAIEAAIVESRAILDENLNTMLGKILRDFAIGVAIKAVILIALFGAYKLGWMDKSTFLIVSAIALTAYLIRDVIKALPTALPALRHIHAHKWRPKRAATEFVAASVFEQTLERAQTQLGSAKRTDKVVMTLSGRNADQISAEVAEAVSEVARETSWDQIRPRVLVTAFKVGTLMCFYSAYVFFLMRLT